MGEDTIGHGGIPWHVDDEQLQRMARDRWHGEVEAVPQDEAHDRGNDIRQCVITVWWD